MENVKKFTNLNRYVSFMMLMLTMSSFAHAQLYIGQDGMSHSRIHLYNDTVEVYITRNRMGLIKYYKMDLTKDTMIFDNLKLYVLKSERYGLDSVFNDAHLVKSADSIIILGTHYIFLSEKEHYKRIDIERYKPWDMNDSCFTREYAYQKKRLKGVYKIDNTHFNYDIINKDTLALSSHVKINILTDSTGYIKYLSEKIKFTFVLNNCHIQIKTIEKPFPLLNLREDTIFDYSFDRLVFRNLLIFVNTTRTEKNWDKHKEKWEKIKYY